MIRLPCERNFTKLELHGSPAEMRELGTLPLRSVALAASLSIIPFGERLDPRAEPLTLLFYLFPFCLTVFWLKLRRSPGDWFRGWLIGLDGYSGYQYALYVTRIPRPNSLQEQLYICRVTQPVAHGSRDCTWVWDRKRINHLTAGFMVGSHRRYG